MTACYDSNNYALVSDISERTMMKTVASFSFSQLSKLIVFMLLLCCGDFGFVTIFRDSWGEPRMIASTGVQLKETSSSSLEMKWYCMFNWKSSMEDQESQTVPDLEENKILNGLVPTTQAYTA
ncbi:Uncharacterized protein Adt_33257 [Abeliophyllum distichum]|uniref:Uncharacterized protein n=1 Tax=Abeliophyllum distichum TaxID=126358 RepID=A0ABD1QVQ3_9LAMI